MFLLGGDNDMRFGFAIVEKRKKLDSFRPICLSPKKNPPPRRNPRSRNTFLQNREELLKKNIQTFTIYICKVLKEVHPDIGVSSKAMGIRNGFINDIFLRNLLRRRRGFVATTRSSPLLGGISRPLGSSS
ncbi:hypothetical protein AMTRI_Chr05g61320 [Amborella trichopoda]